jgi:hypothetical protein
MGRLLACCQGGHGRVVLDLCTGACARAHFWGAGFACLCTCMCANTVLTRAMANTCERGKQLRAHVILMYTSICTCGCVPGTLSPERRDTSWSPDGNIMATTHKPRRESRQAHNTVVSHSCEYVYDYSMQASFMHDHRDYYERAHEPQTLPHKDEPLVIYPKSNFGNPQIRPALRLRKGRLNSTCTCKIPREAGNQAAEWARVITARWRRGDQQRPMAPPISC